MRTKNIEMEYDFPKSLEVTSNVKSKKYDLAKAAKIILYKIFNYSNIKLTISYNTKLLRQLSSKGIDFQALLLNPVEGTFVLFLREDSDTSDTLLLAHEMIHLKQHIENKLYMPNVQEVYWMGEKFDNSTPYEERP